MITGNKKKIIVIIIVIVIILTKQNGDNGTMLDNDTWTTLFSTVM